MSAVLTPPRAALGGTAVLMACACGTAANSAKLLALAGVGASTKVVHPVFIALAAGLIVYGLWRTLRSSAYLAMGAFAVLSAAAVLTPPMAMSSGAMPWNGVQVLGAGLYLVAVALLGYAFWRAFPSAKPAASGTAIGGVALATGCTCCMATGALAGLAVTGGASTAFQSSHLIFWSGLAIVAAGLFRLGGWRAAAFVPLGGAIVEWGPDLLRLAGDWMVGDANLRTYPSYLLTILGTATLLYGFVVAYRRADVRAEPAPVRPEPAREPELAGV